jgi:hypothetical protein
VVKERGFSAYASQEKGHFARTAKQEPTKASKNSSVDNWRSQRLPGEIRRPSADPGSGSRGGLVLTAALIAEIESAQFAVLNQKQSLTGAGKSAKGNTDYL